MPQPIDVGSILGGRYKVTGRILASAENDVILDGLDQVLNRPVSILVSAVENSQHLTQSAREVATGARVSNVSILDLGVQDKATYLIAARTSSADLLDLVVPTDPAEEVYQEPFFTDTLGTEIFGQARDAAPAGGAYVYEDNSPLTPAESLPKVSREETRHDTAAVPTPPPAAAVAPAAAVVPPTAAQQTPAAAKVTLWDEDDYGFINEEHQEDLAESRSAGTFPAALRGSGDGDGYTGDEALDEEDDGNAPRTSGRWLTGAIVGVLLIGALIFAFQHIGTLFNGSNNQAGTTTSAATPGESPQQSSDAPAEPKPVAPVITGLTDITAYAPGVQNYGETYFPRLKEAIDGNNATYWPTVEFSGDDFAGMTESIDLVVELAEESTIGSVTINQLAGSGGQFNILTNNKPELEGATKIGSGSFSAPDFTFTAAPGIKAKYVIVSFTQLPKLQPFVTYPYGLKITEISVK